MEWVILLLVVPAILLPAVLLGGFAGCGFCGDPGRPVVTAIAQSGNAILVSWSGYGGSGEHHYDVERSRYNPDTGEWAVETTLQWWSATFLDSALDPGTMYSYRVRLLITGGDCPDETDWSDAATATTLFNVAYGVPWPDAPVLDRDQSALEGWCLVQRIEPQWLHHSGSRVRITVMGHSAAPLELTRITISAGFSPPGPPGGPDEAFDAVADPVTVVDAPISIAPGFAYTTPTIDYNLDRTRPVLVAFDLAPSGGNVRYAEIPQGPAGMYLKAGSPAAPVQEAATRNRSGYTLSEPDPGTTTTVYLVQTIEVA